MNPTGLVWLFHLIENVRWYGFKCIAILPLVSLKNEKQRCCAEYQFQTFQEELSSFVRMKPCYSSVMSQKRKNVVFMHSKDPCPGHIRSFSALLWVWKVQGIHSALWAHTWKGHSGLGAELKLIPGIELLPTNYRQNIQIQSLQCVSNLVALRKPSPFMHKKRG